MRRIIEDLERIIEDLENGDNDMAVYGVRYHHESGIENGSILPESFEWDDGVCTEEELDGTCSVDVKSMVDNGFSAKDIVDYVEMYSCDKELGEIIIISGDIYSWGNDDYEVIVSDARKEA